MLEEHKEENTEIIDGGNLIIANRVTSVVLTIPLRKWNNLKKRISRIEPLRSKYKDMIYAMIGVGVTALFTGLTGIWPTFNKWLLLICGAILLVSVTSILCLKSFVKKEDARVKIDKEYVLEYIQDIEDDFDLSSIKENK